MLQLKQLLRFYNTISRQNKVENVFAKNDNDGRNSNGNIKLPEVPLHNISEILRKGIISKSQFDSLISLNEHRLSPQNCIIYNYV